MLSGSEVCLDYLLLVYLMNHLLIKWDINGHLIPGIIWWYVSVGVSDVDIEVAHGVLEAMGCCES